MPLFAQGGWDPIRGLMAFFAGAIEVAWRLVVCVAGFAFGLFVGKRWTCMAVLAGQRRVAAFERKIRGFEVVEAHR